MATTTNYAWETPDDTDLVKDGAAAIRTLGSSIDTTTKALNPETTLGDISYRSSTANTKTRLGIGTTGQVLTVAGGVPTWASPAGGGKLLQVVSATTSTAVTISSTTNTDTGITATITPTASTSKILILISGAVWGSQTSVTSYFYGGRIVRGSTTIMDQGAYGLNGIQVAGSNATMGIGTNVALNYLDSPATTSATTYKLQARTNSGGALYWQQDNVCASTIVLMEIGA